VAATTTPPLFDTRVVSWTWISFTATEGRRMASHSAHCCPRTGYTTFDNGFVNTASTKSAITYIDGDAGILRYPATHEQLPRSRPSSRSATLLINGSCLTRNSWPRSTDQISDTPCCTRT